MLPQAVTTVWRTELGTTLSIGFNSTTEHRPTSATCAPISMPRNPHMNQVPLSYGPALRGRLACGGEPAASMRASAFCWQAACSRRWGGTVGTPPCSPVSISEACDPFVSSGMIGTSAGAAPAGTLVIFFAANRMVITSLDGVYPFARGTVADSLAGAAVSELDGQQCAVARQQIGRLEVNSIGCRTNFHWSKPRMLSQAQRTTILELNGLDGSPPSRRACPARNEICRSLNGCR